MMICRRWSLGMTSHQSCFHVKQLRIMLVEINQKVSTIQLSPGNVTIPLKPEDYLPFVRPSRVFVYIVL